MEGGDRVVGGTVVDGVWKMDGGVGVMVGVVDGQGVIEVMSGWFEVVKSWDEVGELEIGVLVFVIQSVVVDFSIVVFAAVVVVQADFVELVVFHIVVALVVFVVVGDHIVAV